MVLPDLPVLRRFELEAIQELLGFRKVGALSFDPVLVLLLEMQRMPDLKELFRAIGILNLLKAITLKLCVPFFLKVFKLLRSERVQAWLPFWEQLHPIGS